VASIRGIESLSKGVNSRRTEKRESLSLKDKPQEEKEIVKEVEDEEDESDLNFEEIKRQVLESKPVAEPKPAVVEVQPIISVDPTPETVVEKIETPELNVEIIKEVQEEKKEGVQIIGKIDLDAINQKTRPDKKKGGALAK
jgi:translation initiation factor IF-2